MNLRLSTAVLLITLTAGSHLYASEAVKKAETLVTDFREIVFRQDTGDSEIKSEFDEVMKEFRTLSLEESESLYYESLLEYWMGRAYQSFDKVETVINHHNDVQNGKYMKLKRHYSAIDETIYHYDRSLQAIEAYLKINSDSEGLRQYSEVQGQMILMRPPGYALKNGMSVKRTLKKSLKLNPDNIKSIIMDGASDIYTPSAYGGNVDKGIARLEELIPRPGCDREDLFNIYTGIAYGLIISERESEALSWLGKAEEIFPHNIYLNGLKQLAAEGQ
ncbi:MAG: hypothetical protein PQJ58_05270 [Spirochaetales bacterium]|nr:hypothetical protein [Spirochaetales bacterium]